MEQIQENAHAAAAPQNRNDSINKKTKNSNQEV